MLSSLCLCHSTRRKFGISSQNGKAPWVGKGDQGATPSGERSARLSGSRTCHCGSHMPSNEFRSVTATMSRAPNHTLTSAWCGIMPGTAQLKKLSGRSCNRDSIDLSVAAICVATAKACTLPVMLHTRPNQRMLNLGKTDTAACCLAAYYMEFTVKERRTPSRLMSMTPQRTDCTTPLSMMYAIQLCGSRIMTHRLIQSTSSTSKFKIDIVKDICSAAATPSGSGPNPLTVRDVVLYGVLDASHRFPLLPFPSFRHARLS
mmetsp:Transcript_7547/g.19453  ORF Transcript_7547/g.19453 Transcript_7547/m.19453 type:complete len:260 (-) Transcript_7547:219-998(-)